MAHLNDLPAGVDPFDPRDSGDMLTEDLSALAAAANSNLRKRQEKNHTCQLRAMRHKTFEVAAAIASAGVVYLIVAVVEMNMSTTLTTAMAAMAIGTLYIGMACWATLSPLRVATMALVIFGATFAVTIATLPPSPYQASHFVVVALLVAFGLARQHRVLERQEAALAHHS